MAGDDKHDHDQSQRFKDAARELGADESEERFNAALGKITRHKPKTNEGSEPPSDERINEGSDRGEKP